MNVLYFIMQRCCIVLASLNENVFAKYWSIPLGVFSMQESRYLNRYHGTRKLFFDDIAQRSLKATNRVSVFVHTIVYNTTV